MSNKSKLILDTMFDIGSYAADKNIIWQFTDDKKIEDANIYINNKKYTHFSSCSYLGLEHNESIKKGAINAVIKYGTQFSSSKAYASLSLYSEIEEKFEKLFGCPVLIAGSTTLAHVGVIPVIIEPEDHFILDHQVHASVQSAVNLALGKYKSITHELIKHNDIERLEARLIELKEFKGNIWYFADSIYSMFGDQVNLKELLRLLNTYNNFYFYVDDAHGMSCYGKNGVGYVLSEIGLNKKMVIATSLAKSFGVGGGVIITNNSALYNKAKYTASTLITSGPIQPANLGAINASLDIHLSEKIHLLQNELHEKTIYCKKLIDSTDLPLIKRCDTPIFFIGVGQPKLAIDLVAKMKENGYLTNIGMFPAVPLKNSGLRFTITRLLSKEQIAEFVISLEQTYKTLLKENNVNIEDVYKAFKLLPKELI